MSLEQVALLDIDGTLINDRYQFTDSGIGEAVANAEARGWKVGLSSDTPYEAMLNWKKKIGANGPVIAENGAVVEADSSLHYNKDAAGKFNATYDGFKKHCAELPLTLWEGNPVESLRADSLTRAPGETIVMLNNLRRCSFSFYVRGVNQSNELVVDNQKLDRLITIARAYFPVAVELTEDFNVEFGLLILGLKSTNKREGTKQLLRRQRIGKIAMIGNSSNDFVGHDLAEHYAVSNASPEFKGKAKYVSPHSTTTGVIDILNSL